MNLDFKLPCTGKCITACLLQFSIAIEIYDTFFKDGEAVQMHKMDSVRPPSELHPRQEYCAKIYSDLLNKLYRTIFKPISES